VGLSDASAIGAGAHHTCALLSTGGARCWGNNQYGQLGDGTCVHSVTPVSVKSLPERLTAIAGGSSHTCARTYDAVKCWGENTHGELGDGTTLDRYTPAAVVGLGAVPIADITLGNNYSCAVVTAKPPVGHIIQCWGYNPLGQLGDGTNTNRHEPIRVSGVEGGVYSMSAGSFHACAVVETAVWPNPPAARAVKCWGLNDYGQLGEPPHTVRYTPVPIAGLRDGVSAVTAGGRHNCGLANGGVMCWGANRFGQLGDGTTIDRHVPVVVAGIGSPLPAPVADFIATPTTGMAPLTVAFSNRSSGPFSASLWDFGDGTTSSDTHPTHTYLAHGSYTVSLKVNGIGGSQTLVHPNYITAFSEAMKELMYLPLVRR
jgi:hypothetical protein